MKKIFRMAAFMLALGSMTAGFTSCGEDDENEATPDNVAESLKFSELTAIANPDGTIDISGTIESNTKLKEFCLYAEDGKTVVYDFLKDNEQVKQKNEVLDDNGKASKEKSFKLDIASKSVPVAIYKLAIKTKGTKEFSETIGSKYSFELGYGDKSTLGSYVSVVEQKSYTQGEVEGDTKISANVEFVLAKDGLKPASQAANAVNGKVTNYAKSAIYSNTIITSTGCIATYELKENADGKNGTMSGVIINSKGTIKIKAAKESDLSK